MFDLMSRQIITRLSDMFTYEPDAYHPGNGSGSACRYSSAIPTAATKCGHYGRMFAHHVVSLDAGGACPMPSATS